WAILPYANFPELLASLSADPAWTLVHVDPVAVVFVRAGPEGEARASPALAGILSPSPVTLAGVPGFPGGPERPSRCDVWLDGLIHRQSVPLREQELGRFHLHRGAAAPAAAWLAEAARA